MRMYMYHKTSNLAIRACTCMDNLLHVYIHCTCTDPFPYERWGVWVRDYGANSLSYECAVIRERLQAYVPQHRQILLSVRCSVEVLYGHCMPASAAVTVMQMVQVYMYMYVL